MVPQFEGDFLFCKEREDPALRTIGGCCSSRCSRLGVSSSGDSLGGLGMLNRNLTTQLEKRSDYWNGIEAPGPGSCIGLADGIRRHGVLATAFRSSFSAAEEVFEAAHVVHVGHAAFTTAHFSHEATESTHASAASSAHVTHAAELLHHVLHFAF